MADLRYLARRHLGIGAPVRRWTAYDRFRSNLRSAESHPLAAFLSFSDEAAGIGLGPDWRGMVADLEAEGSALIGAVPCPDAIPHGWEHSQTGEVLDFTGGPCPSCGAVV